MDSKTSRIGDHIYRAAFALVAGRTVPGGEAAYLRQREKAGDQITEKLVRSASQPMTTANTPELAGSIVIDFLRNLAPASAAAGLIARAPALQLGGDGQFGTTIPALRPKATAGAFIGEGEPIPVEQFVVTGPTIEPRTMGIISALTQDMARSTNGEALIRQVMTESATLTLDMALLGDAAASASAPAGLLRDAVSVTPTAGGGAPAMNADLFGLVAALAPGVRANIVLVTDPVTALKIRLLGGGNVPYDVLPSEQIPVGTLVAIGLDGLVFAGDSDPKIDASGEAVLHREDNTPLHISSPGSPNVAAAPVTSLFQTAQIAIRLLIDISWTTRIPATVAVVRGVSW